MGATVAGPLGAGVGDEGARWAFRWGGAGRAGPDSSPDRICEFPRRLPRAGDLPPSTVADGVGVGLAGPGVAVGASVSGAGVGVGVAGSAVSEAGGGIGVSAGGAVGVWVGVAVGVGVSVGVGVAVVVGTGVGAGVATGPRSSTSWTAAGRPLKLTWSTGVPAGTSTASVSC